MAGRLGRNFRRGHLAEWIGLDLFRPFATVSQVSQEDDTGIDAFVTLLRKKGTLLHTGRSFFLQVKSTSVTSVWYSPEEVQWLESLELPFLFATVDIKKLTVRVYSTNAWLSQPWLDFSQGVEMTWGTTQSVRASGGPAQIGIGVPIAEWTGLEVMDDSKAQRIMDVLTSWCFAMENNLQLRRIGIAAFYAWETNASPLLDGYESRPTGTSLDAALEAAAPYILAVAHAAADHHSFDTSGLRHFLSESAKHGLRQHNTHLTAAGLLLSPSIVKSETPD